jgi:4-alpha-glucanotransferase
VDYHQWLQWLVDQQLAAVDGVAVMQDLPIGFSGRGADAWTWQDVLADGVTVGAPPDLYNTQGQNWGFPPWIPSKLQDADYEPFVQTIRAMLRHAGGLRIDHVMGLFRLFWIPAGMSAVDGTYVKYPAADLLNIISLESVRAGAFVVGEDLGTVGQNVRRMLAAANILSTRLLYFEKVPPTKYPKLAMAAVTTHDLPTVAGLWSGSDLAAQQTMDLQPDAAAFSLIHNRLQALTGLAPDAPTVDVVRATYEALGRSPSAVVTATLEDALAVEERPNMPATTWQWPNWRIALPEPLETLVEAPLAAEIAQSLTRSRRRSAPAAPADQPELRAG